MHFDKALLSVGLEVPSYDPGCLVAMVPVVAGLLVNDLQKPRALSLLERTYSSFIKHQLCLGQPFALQIDEEDI
jgi:hypothetical protein